MSSLRVSSDFRVGSSINDLAELYLGQGSDEELAVILVNGVATVGHCETSVNTWRGEEGLEGGEG